MTTPARIPDWFDVLWETHQHKIPFLLRNDAGKRIAREIIGLAIQGAATYSTTPQGVRALIAFSRIQAITRGVQGVCESPDPSPEQVADAVERLVQKVKP
jgi:hypothetical protein